jgi:hypothetical protein
LAGIILTELDAVVSGNLRHPLPTAVPVWLAPEVSLLSSGNAWTFSTPDLISAVDQDVDCFDDTEYATIDLSAGGISAQSFGFAPSPIYGTWSAISLRTRAAVTGGSTQIALDFTIGGATYQGTFENMTVGAWANYRAVFTGTYDNTDIDGITANIRFQNTDGSNSSQVMVSGVDIVVEGVPSALEQIKIVPFYELQSYGTHHGSIVDIYEGLVWPPDASLDPNLPLVPSGDFVTSPDPLPKPYVSEPQSDQDYETFLLSYDQRSSIIEYGFSDPTVPPLLPPLPPGPPPPPPSPPGPPPPPSPPSPPGPPSPPSPPPTEQYFTSVTVRMRLHQDPRIVPPSIINIPPSPPYQLMPPGAVSALPQAPVGQIFPPDGSPYQFQVTGGNPPYTWFTYIVPTIGSNVAGVPPGIDAYQDPSDSSLFDYLGTPTTAAIYQFGITVNDSKGRGISWALTHNIIAPGPPPGPPAPPLPPGPLPPPPLPPPSPPLPPPPSPPIPDMVMWVPNYSSGVDPGDPSTIWDAPNVKPPDDGLNHQPVTQIQFNNLGETVEISGGPPYLTEEAGYSRSGLVWKTVVLSDINGLNSGLVAQILGVPSSNPPPTTITGSGTDYFTVKLTYQGVAGVPESGEVSISVTGTPDATGNLNNQGGAGTTIYWAYLSPLVILTSSLPDGTVSQPYSEALVAKGGQPPYFWGMLSAIGSGLPPGITLSSDGHLTGVPIQAATFLFRVGVADAKGQQQSANLSITVNTPPLPPPPLPPSPPPPPHPVLPPPPGPPSPPGLPGPPVFVIEEVPGIEVRYQPLVPDKCSNTTAGLGPVMINDYLIPRPDASFSGSISDGPWSNFSHTWFGFWTSEQLSELMVEVQFNLVEPISVGAQNNLYISALDVVVTRAILPTAAPWLASMKPEGRIKWMITRGSTETGPNSGKWYDDDQLPWQANSSSGVTINPYMSSILGTAQKGGATQAAANSVLDRYEILGWLDRDGDRSSSAGDTPGYTMQAYLDANIGVLDTTILIKNINALRDPFEKYFQGFLVDDELIVVQKDQIDYTNGLLNFVWRGINETREADHARGTVLYPVAFWELMYEIKVAGAVPPVDFQGHAVGWNSTAGNDDGTPGELLQNGAIDLRAFSGAYPIRWMLRLRVFDVYGLNTDSDTTLPGYPDQFKSFGSGAYMTPSGNIFVPSKRLLYVTQIRPPGKPRIIGGG